MNRTNDDLRRMIEDAVGSDEEVLDEIILLEGDEFADGAVGLSYDYHVVYDYNKLVTSLQQHNGWTETEAIEWLDYNTLGSLGYAATLGNEPIIIIASFDD